MNPLSLDQPWGRGYRPTHTHAFADGSQLPSTPFLPRGLGRSYGDVCLNDGGTLLHNFRRDRLLAFDHARGVLRCESGATLADIAQTLLPRGWFLPVVPGTRFVTVGGALANDVHGKNHHVAGSFGRFVESLSLMRSDVSSSLTLSGDDTLYSATIGGLGLTGLILEASLRLKAVPGPGIEQEVRLFGGERGAGGIADYLALDAESKTWEYTVGWIDTLDRNLRGVFFRGRHCEGPDEWLVPQPTRLMLPIDAPQWVLGRCSARAFNALYYRLHSIKTAQRSVIPIWPFFFPLDAVNGWNRAYGRRGFIQYQFVVPTVGARETIPRILAHLREAGVASYLAVIKTFGDLPSPGWLSFPMAGTTVALDVPAPGSDDRRALDEADAMVADAGGRVYPAKDARMSPAMFRRFFPRWHELEAARDPLISSSFWRRVTGDLKA
ncbi:MAG: FAD-binding oxidoreductase [Burkholderiales bacterium]|nr:FAD-binding oxidoreductase [Burkholderiales bacterium]